MKDVRQAVIDVAMGETLPYQPDQLRKFAAVSSVYLTAAISCFLQREYGSLERLNDHDQAIMRVLLGLASDVPVHAYAWNAIYDEERKTGCLGELVVPYESLTLDQRQMPHRRISQCEGICS